MSDFGEDLNTPKIAVVGFIAVIVIIALIILMQVMFYWAEAQQRLIKDVDQPYLEYANIKADQQAKLAKYQWLDQKEKIVAIPIKRAMELVVDDLSKKSPLPLGEGQGEGNSANDKMPSNNFDMGVKSPGKGEK
jgi:predicted lipid-binding transport protein (Tim44 family)